MIAGLFATSTVNLVGSHLLDSRLSQPFAWDREAVDALFHFGRGCS